MIYIFWFEEDLISLYNEYKIEAKYVSDQNSKSKSMRKNYHNLKINVRVILLLCNMMPDMKPWDTTEILSWKNLSKKMANDAITKLVFASIKKGLIEDEKDLTVTFVRNKYFGKKNYVTHFYCQRVMGENISSIPIT